MFRNLLLTFGILLTSSLLVFSQSGTLKGKVLDKEKKEPIPFANIVIELGGTMSGGATSDFEGNYIIKPIPPGRYDVKATYVGYKTSVTRGIVIAADQIRFYDIELESTTQVLEEIVVTDYKVPLIDKDQTTSGGTVTSEEIQKMPNRDVNSVATTVGGVFSADGEMGNVRGARNDATVMYIDGIKVTGSSALPPSAIEQVTVLLGGLPAQYGDARGGVINVTTKGPSRKFGAGFELETSQFLDPYGYNRFGFNLQGPLIKGKKEGESSLLGYFMAGDLSYQKDGFPNSTGIYVAKDDLLNYLEQYPLRPSGLAGGGTFTNGSFISKSDLDKVKTTKNTSQYDASFSAKIDVKTGKTTNLTFGGQFIYGAGRNFSFANSMFNWDKNVYTQNYNWRVFGRFVHRFPTDKDSKSLIKNVYYQIQADYQRGHGLTQDADHKDKIFQYGYLGQFKTYKMATYELGSVDVNGVTYNDVWKLNSWDFDTTFSFNPSHYNPLLARYTEQIYEFYPNKWGSFPLGEGNWMNADQLQLNGGRLNGQGGAAFYQMFNAPGTVQAGYAVNENSQIGINVAAAADIGNHEVKFGFQYEQSKASGYNYAAAGLWRLMNYLTNFHIRELDTENPMLVTENGVFQDTVIFYRNYNEDEQRIFDKNLRKKLGLPVDGLDYILIDSYDLDNRTIDYYDKEGNLKSITVSEDLYDVDMFSADELLYDGAYFGYWYGYDHKGNRLTKRPSFDDFFTEKDADGNYTRPIPAYEPIYMAGYIQDKFAFRDLIFNIGVRVDRFDANQMVLKDNYLLYPAKTVKDVGDVSGTPVTHPSNMGSDYVVYVDDVKNPTKIMGYRNEDTWYNANGIEVGDPYVIQGPSGIAPALKDPNQESITAEAFKDYEPQINVMPRIAFSFPISDEALFFAHYDVLTQRPTSNVYTDPSTYYFINTVGGNINNPSLKPAKTIDYELGFQQRLSNTSSLKLSAFYRENRDDIQIFRFNGVYPRDYTSFNNIDFGTVKGLTVTYDLRRTNNARINASYTLQFADGTGSSTTTAAALIASGLPNLRTTNPLAWDRRHNFTFLVDYRYGGGDKYNGPVIKKKVKGTDKVKTVQILSNAGMSVTLTGGSGTPYTRQENITSFLSGGSRILKGTYYGSRLPWQFRVDTKFDKEFYITRKTEKKGASQPYLDVYLQINNIFDFRNVMGVYPATGNPDDDGYLAAAEWQREINDQLNPQTYRDLYSIAVNSPYNYSSPRIVRVGVIFNF